MMTVRSRLARQGHPAVAGGVHGRLQADRRELGTHPLARVAPHRPPGQALRAVSSGGPRGQLSEIGDDVPGAHARAS